MSEPLKNAPLRRPTHQEICERAYKIYLKRGGQHGRDVDDWLQAEYELMQLPTRIIAELKPPKPSQVPPGKKSIINVVRAASP